MNVCLYSCYSYEYDQSRYTPTPKSSKSIEVKVEGGKDDSEYHYGYKSSR